MLLKEAINRIPGFRYMIENLDFRFPAARRMLYETAICTHKAGTEQMLCRLDRAYMFVKSGPGRSAAERIKIKNAELRDISGTLDRLGRCMAIGDIELFEIKSFAVLSGEIRLLAAEICDIPDIREVLRILDPQQSGTAHFAVYDYFLPELATVRAKIKVLQKHGSDIQTGAELEKLMTENLRLEDKVRTQLSDSLRPHVPEMKKALHALAQLDILLAKALQAVSMKLCRPVPGDGECRLEGLFNPAVATELAPRNRSFQAVDISFGPYPTLITGANMGGKSVILKSVALVQALMQFGFYVPARKAELRVVEQIAIIGGDMQPELSGLSSFASEIKRLNEVTRAVKEGRNVLLLYDEPARTTNPQEGQALVNAIVCFLSDKKVSSLITTHYSGIGAPRRLRVRGLENYKGDLSGPGSLGDAMDYRLREEVTDEAPNEAFRIARAFGADGEILSHAEKLMANGNNRKNAEK